MYTPEYDVKNREEIVKEGYVDDFFEGDPPEEYDPEQIKWEKEWV